jgi:glycosyltransferase involved in cell wall biosynthesis
MRLAFYAPLKAPDHPVASGDRAMARAIMTALTGLNAEVTLASTLRSRDGTGDRAQQARIAAEAEAEIARLVPMGRAAGWQGWLTYHNYYKAPDLIGPQVSAALNIPYLLIEASRARKRLQGDWADFARAAEAATDAARVVFYFTDHDAEALQRDAPAGQDLIRLRPFLDRDSLPAQTQGAPQTMLSVGMMRPGDKLASYRILADTLALLPDTGWRLEIAGDGAARAEVAAMMAPYGAAVRFLGALEPQAMEAAYRRAALLVWPGVNEAFGLTYLEAQAAGLAVVAQDRPGVREVLAPGPAHPAPEDGATALAARLGDLLADPARCRAEGRAGRSHVAQFHLRPAARESLRTGLDRAGVGA